jgi:hypothetical protein
MWDQELDAASSVAGEWMESSNHCRVPVTSWPRSVSQVRRSPRALSYCRGGPGPRRHLSSDNLALQQEEAGQVSSGMRPRVPSLRRVIRASVQAPIELGGGLRAGDSPPIAIRMLTPTASWRTAGSLSCGDCGRIANRLMKPTCTPARSPSQANSIG